MRFRLFKTNDTSAIWFQKLYLQIVFQLFNFYLITTAISVDKHVLKQASKHCKELQQCKPTVKWVICFLLKKFTDPTSSSSFMFQISFKNAQFPQRQRCSRKLHQLNHKIFGVGRKILIQSSESTRNCSQMILVECLLSFILWANSSKWLPAMWS